jgi:preprotein translocase subunit YajC
MNKNKLILSVIAVIVLIALFLYYTSTQKEKAIQMEEINTLDQITNDDTVESIQSTLDSIDIGSELDEDLKSIDAELKVL